MFPNIWIFDSIFQTTHPDGWYCAEKGQSWAHKLGRGVARKGQENKKGGIKEKFKRKICEERLKCFKSTFFKKGERSYVS